MIAAAGIQAAVRHLIDSTREVFETMLATSITAGVPIEGDTLRPGSNIVATVGFAGDESGAVAFYTTFATAGQIATRLLGSGVPSQEAVADAVGEVANLIAGTFRDHLARDGGTWTLSMPSVTIGSDFHTRYGSEVRRVLCPFRVWEDEVFVELMLTQGRHGH